MRVNRSVIVCAALLIAAPIAFASTANAAGTAVLTYGAAGSAGTNVNVGDVLQADLASPSTFYSDSTGTTGITCTDSEFTASATNNPTAPGTATESLTDQTFGGCTSNVVGVESVEGVSVTNLPVNVSISDDGTVTTGPIETTIDLDTLLGETACEYSSSGLTGSTSGGEISFANQEFALVSGSSLCPASGYFSAVYAQAIDTSVAGDPLVYVN